MGPSKAVSTDQKPGSLKKEPVNVPKDKKGFAGDDRTNLREDFKRKYGDKDGPAKYYVDYTEKDCSVEDCNDREEGDLT